MRYLLLLLAACGLEDRSGGDSHLPTSGLGPFGKPEVNETTPAEEPFVLAQNGVAYDDPSALADGAGYRLWFTQDGDSIATVRLPALGALPESDPQVVLTGGHAPSVLRLADGSLLMYYATTGGIARAHSADGLDWTQDGQVLSDAADPAALVVGDEIYLYVASAAQTAIELYTSSDGMAFTSVGPVLERRSDVPAAFDRDAVCAPAVAGGLSAAGQLSIQLYWTGRGPMDLTGVGAAGSFDGVHFERFIVNGATEPVLEPGLVSERAPSVVRSADRAVMFFGQDRVSTPAIAVATSP